jgi:hypothetical protein
MAPNRGCQIFLVQCIQTGKMYIPSGNPASNQWPGVDDVIFIIFSQKVVKKWHFLCIGFEFFWPEIGQKRQKI